MRGPAGVWFCRGLDGWIRHAACSCRQHAHQKETDLSDAAGTCFPRLFSPARDAVAPAAGVGLRLNINKHNRTALAVGYGIGLQGSRGLFFNFGEVF